MRTTSAPSCSSKGSATGVAVEALADRRGRDLAAEGVSVVPIGGAQAIRRVARPLRPARPRPRARRSLRRRRGARASGEVWSAPASGPDLSRDDMERLGFYVCDADLEDELIRALGPDAVERVVEAHGRSRPVPHAPEAAGVARPADRTSSFAASSAAAAAGRSATRGSSSTPSSSTACRGRSTASSRTSEPLRLDRRLRFAQVLVDEGDRHAPLAHGRGDALDRARSGRRRRRRSRARSSPGGTGRARAPSGPTRRRRSRSARSRSRRARSRAAASRSRRPRR